MARNVVDRLLNDAEGAEFDLGREPRSGAIKLDINDEPALVLDLHDKPPDGGGETELVKAWRAQAARHRAQLPSNVQDRAPHLSQCLHLTVQTTRSTKPLDATRQLDQCLQGLVVDLPSDPGTFILLGSEQCRRVGMSLYPLATLLGHVLEDDLVDHTSLVVDAGRERAEFALISRQPDHTHDVRMSVCS